MTRNSQFQPGREPLAHEPRLRLRRSHVSGPFSFLNPTRAHYEPSHRPQQQEQRHQPTVPPSKDEEDQFRPEHTTAPDSQTPAVRVERVWRSRDNRKGRHALRVEYADRTTDTGVGAPAPTNTFRTVSRGILRMATYAPYWDVSYLVATSFTLGSAVWIVNAFFAWLPFVDPQTQFRGETLFGCGITAIIGTTIFEIGSVLLLLEAINEEQTGCFGWALESAMKSAEEDAVSSILEFRPSLHDCRHHHANRKAFLDHDGSSTSGTDVQTDTTTDTADATKIPPPSCPSKKERFFRWLPTTTELRTHYLHELGFLASLIQFIAATIFWIAGFTALPGIANHLSLPVQNGVFWVPQIIGGVGFMISGLLFTLETQSKWYIPAPHVLGWHIGAWNLVGGIGFMLCGALGPAAPFSAGAAYQSSLATFWGSWSFMVGSTIQWYESLQKHPVEKD